EVTAMSRISNCDQHVVPPSQINPEIPVEVDEAILMALEKNPNDRYRDAREFQTALRAILSRRYPAYTYADTGRLVSAIFSDEIVQERAELRELNIRAQLALSAGDDRTTTVATGNTNPLIRSVSVHTPPPQSFHQTGEGLMDFRLSKIE